MKAYWDSSALIQCFADLPLRERLQQEKGCTRPHSLAEAFSVLTSGKLRLRIDASFAAEMIREIADELDFVDLSSGEVIEALLQARSLGVRGGRVHDYLHVVAAAKSGAQRLLTCDRHDFSGLSNRLEIEQV